VGFCAFGTSPGSSVNNSAEITGSFNNHSTIRGLAAQPRTSFRERWRIAAVHAVDPTVAPAEPKTTDEVVDGSMANKRFALILSSTFAAAALFLAALGIYGAMSFSVARRAHQNDRGTRALRGPRAARGA
jgi:hypothetical protein